MIKMNSISGIACYVKDLDKTSKFYEALGFRPGKTETDHFTVYVNWFWIEFRIVGEQQVTNEGIGSYTYIKVDNVDEFYEFALSKGLKPSAEPSNQPSGNREFVINDPDGYKLVFFQKI